MLARHAPTWLIQFPSLVREEQQAGLQRGILGATRERMVRELCEALEVMTQTDPLVLDPRRSPLGGSLYPRCHLGHRSQARTRQAVGGGHVPTSRSDSVRESSQSAQTGLAPAPLEPRSGARTAARVRCRRLSSRPSMRPATLPAGLARVIHRHSDGNPLFMSAMLDHLAQRGILVKSRGHWTVTVPLEQIDPGVPETLKQMLETQLAHATEAEQQLLKCASVAGHHFTAWSVATMLDERRHPFGGDVRSAGRAITSFWRALGPASWPIEVPTPEFRFRHALYREVLYRRLNRLPACHASIVAWRRGSRRFAHPSNQRWPPRSRRTSRRVMSTNVPIRSIDTGGPKRNAPVRTPAVGFDPRTRARASSEGCGGAPAGARSFRLSRESRMRTTHWETWSVRLESTQSMAMTAAESGRLTARADALTRLGHPSESIPFFLRAVELEPNFAAAYTALSRIYSNLGEAEQATDYAKLAYARREQVSERERLSITYQYHYEVTGDQVRATQSLEEWKHAFPEDFRPVNSLALIHNFLGRFERAIEEGHEAVRRNPTHGYPYSNLAHAYRGVGQFDAARHTAEQAVALQIETLPTRCLLYELAVIAGDEQSAARHVDLGQRPAARVRHDWRARPGRRVVGPGSRSSGTLRRCRTGGRFPQSSRRWAEPPRVGHSMELAYGNILTPRRDWRGACSQRKPSYDPRLRVALALATAGSVREAETIVQDLTAAHPEHTFINVGVRADCEGGHRPWARAARAGDRAASNGRAVRAGLHRRAGANSLARPFVSDDGARGVRQPRSFNAFSIIAAATRFRRSTRSRGWDWRER